MREELLHRIEIVPLKNSTDFFNIDYGGTPVGSICNVGNSVLSKLRFEKFFSESATSEREAAIGLVERFLERVYKVQLSSAHSEYQSLYFFAEHYAVPSVSVVWVDTRRFMECFSHEQHGFYLPPVAQWSIEDQNGIREYLNPVSGAVPMPYVAFDIHNVSVGCWPFRKKRPLGVAMFNNGRHRARYIEHAGAGSFPVEVACKDVAALIAWCGVER